MRIDPKQKWHPVYLLQPFYNIVLACFFEWGVAVHDLDFEAIRKGTKSKQQLRDELKAIGTKARRQIVKDYILFPALSGKHWRKTLYANLTANFVRNIWSYAIIFCGHFPDQAYTFTEEEVESAWRVVRAPADRRGKHRREPVLPRDEREPFVPSRASHLSRHAELALPTDRTEGERGLRALRPALQHRPVPQAVGLGAAHDPAPGVPRR